MTWFWISIGVWIALQMPLGIWVCHFIASGEPKPRLPVWVEDVRGGRWE
jgi:hypothetical protein